MNCGETVLLDRGGEIRCENCGRLDQEEVDANLNTEPLETIARKVCRLVIKSANESDAVRDRLMAAKSQKDGDFRAMVKAIGEETPGVAGNINDLDVDVEGFVFGWAVLNAKVLFEEW